MSADNYYIIRIHPDGGYTPVMGFASDDETPEARSTHDRYDTISQAWDAASGYYAEYGVSVHPECGTDDRIKELPEATVWAALLAILPDAEFSADEDGFLVVSTGLMYTGESGENLIGRIRA